MVLQLCLTAERREDHTNFDGVYCALVSCASGFEMMKEFGETRILRPWAGDRACSRYRSYFQMRATLSLIPRTKDRNLRCSSGSLLQMKGPVQVKVLRVSTIDSTPRVRSRCCQGVSRWPSSRGGPGRAASTGEGRAEGCVAYHADSGQHADRRSLPACIRSFGPRLCPLDGVRGCSGHAHGAFRRT